MMQQEPMDSGDNRGKYHKLHIEKDIFQQNYEEIKCASQIDNTNRCRIINCNKNYIRGRIERFEELQVILLLNTNR